MEEELSLDNILETEDIENLFSEQETQEITNSESPEEDKETTETVNVDNLFTDESESVGSEENNARDKEDTGLSNDKGASPTNNFYSSIAKALREEGIFQNLDDEVNISSAEDFAKAMRDEITAQFDERQKRIDEALNAGVEPLEIKRYENTLGYLNSLQDSHLADESEKGEKLREQLIYQDFINRGYSKERALREVKKSFNSGTDIEDAKEALISNKEFFQNEYDSLIQEAQEEEKEKYREEKSRRNSLKSLF